MQYGADNSSASPHAGITLLATVKLKNPNPIPILKYSNYRIMLGSGAEYATPVNMYAASRQLILRYCSETQLTGTISNIKTFKLMSPGNFPKSLVTRTLATRTDWPHPVQCPWAR